MFLNLRGLYSGASTFLFGGGRIQARCLCGIRRASRAGSEKGIQDAGALRAPARTNDVFEFGVLIFGKFLINFVDFRV